MLTERKRKLLTSLHQKKYRLKHRMFLLEGEKIILDALRRQVKNRIRIDEVFATEQWIHAHSDSLEGKGVAVQQVTSDELKKLSTLVTPQEVLSLARIPAGSFSPDNLEKEVVVVLDRIRDPGNLGTIIRSADWFGIRYIICSLDSVDAYNAKVVQASMGAILRVQLYYESIHDIMEQAKKNGIPCIGTTLGGENLYDIELSVPMLLIAGNESSGISEETRLLLDMEVTIPAGDREENATESLNVGSAVSVIMSELNRRKLR